MTAPLVALVAVLGALALVGLGGDDDLGKVAVEPQPSTSTSSTTVPTTATTVPTSEEGLAVVPDAGLATGDQVEVRVDGSGGPLIAAQCANTAFTGGGNRFCDGLTFQVLRSGEGDPLQPIEIRRFVRTYEGFVDCAEAAGRCHLLVADGTLADWDEASTRSVPLNFDPARAVDPSVELREEAVTNGDVAFITGRDFPPGHEVWIGQCLPGSTADNEMDRCDSLRSTVTTVSSDGWVQVKFQVSQDIRMWEDESWTPCLDCELVVSAAGLPVVRIPIEITPNGAPIRPSFEILEDGPYTPGQEVTLVGTGFQNGFPPQPGWCMLNTEEPYPSCTYPDESFHPAQSQIDTYIFHNFPMPSGAHADLCLAHPESDCVIAWERGEGTPPTAILRYEMVPN